MPASPTPEFNLVILYVDHPPSSATFYAALLDRPPVESSPTFAMFSLNAGAMLGLWSRHTVEPAAHGNAGASEIALTVADAEGVHRVHAAWIARGVPIAQAPTAMDFGHSFVGLDPDGHRLRVFAPVSP